jgi:outer membrane protein OmpA-like peptidoglycan-associated protein
MRMPVVLLAPAVLLAACAQPAPAPQAAAPAPAATAAAAAPAPDKLIIPFSNGATLSPDAAAKLDEAARLYREGSPIMMYVAGYSDRQGSELQNLFLSARRAAVVKEGLVARGIPAERLQMTAMGEADPAVATGDGVVELQNRRAVVTWK